MYCSHCGCEVSDAAKFCGECGAKVYRGEVQQQRADPSVSSSSETPVEPLISVEPVVESDLPSGEQGQESFTPKVPSIPKVPLSKHETDTKETTNGWFTGVWHWGVGIVSVVVVVLVLDSILPVWGTIVVENSVGALITHVFLWKVFFGRESGKSLSVEWPRNLIGYWITVIGSGTLRYVYILEFIERGPLRLQGIDGASGVGVFFNFGVPALIAMPICMYWRNRSHVVREPVSKKEQSALENETEVVRVHRTGFVQRPMSEISDSPDELLGVIKEIPDGTIDTLVVGRDIDEATVAKHRDPKTGDLYSMSAVKDGEIVAVFVTKDVFEMAPTLRRSLANS
jgi:hypothetical protein